MIGRRGLRSAGAALIAALVVAAAGAAAGNAAAADPTDVVIAKAAQSPGEIRDYWTAARMRAAEPALLLAPDDGGPASGEPSAPATYVPPSNRASGPSNRLRVGVAPAARASDVSADSGTIPRRLHGKVFMTLGSTDYVCSATVVSSASRALVWTAAHCIHGADVDLGYATNWMFVPGYNDGARPFGTWTARRLLAAQGWVDEANMRFDFAAVTVARDAQGRGIEDLIGARGIAFNQPRNQTFDAYGYPAEDRNTPLLPPNFDGERLWLCTSPRTADDNPYPDEGPETLEIGCDMTGGSSGGGWVIGDGFVNSVTSYGYRLDRGRLYGPYLGSAAEELYVTAAGPPLRCAGAQVTNLGTGAANNFTGTDGADGFRMLGGDDRAAGSAGNDAACGGGGADRLAGSDSADRLLGGAGDDVLIGGRGADECIGGPGRDRAFSCEVRRGVP